MSTFAEALRLPDDFTPSSAALVDAIESSLGPMPGGYREFVEAYGAALYCGYVRVYPPERVALAVADWRARVKAHAHWSAGASVLPPDRLVECVIVADTVEGDELVFHPSDRTRLFVLPRHDDVIHAVGEDLDAALTWLTGAGVLTEPIGAAYVQPLSDRATLRATPGPTTTIGYDALVTQLVELGVHEGRIDGEDEDGRHVQLLSPALGGIVTVVDVEPPGPPDVAVEYDPARAKAAAGVEMVLAMHRFTIDRL